jgi:hypothetical protein
MSGELRSPKSVEALEEFGRVELSRSFFMRDFLYSEISQIEGIPNIPDDPDLAIRVGKHLCQEILEPLQARFGRIAIRSAFRSCAVNARGTENGNQYRCANNKSNFAGHIWDRPDVNGHIGAMACIVVPAFLPYYRSTSHWQAMAWWVHDHIPAYSEMQFFPKLAAFNISWHEKPKKKIHSNAPPRGVLTKPGMPNHPGTHEQEYFEFLGLLDKQCFR